jgi:type II secretory pathway pseudopilin PulG
MNAIHRRKRAVTLVELLVVMAMSAAIVGMGTWILISAKKLWVDEQLRIGAARTAALWEYQLCKELRAALPPESLGAKWSGTDGSVGLIESYPRQRFTDALRAELAGTKLADDSIRFATARIRDALGRVRPGIVEYRVERNVATGIYGIMRKAAPDFAGLESAPEGLVAQSVVSLDLQYLNDKDEWLDVWTAGDKSPRAVRITTGAMPERIGANPQVMYFSTEVFLPLGETIKQ